MVRRDTKRKAAGLGLACFLTCLSGAAIASPAASLRPLLLETTVNAAAMEEPQLFLQGEGGALYASAEALRRARLRASTLETVTFDGQAFYRIDKLPSLRIALSEERQSVAIDADPGLFDAQKAEVGTPAMAEMTRPARGAFLNYDAFVEHSNGKATASGAFELNAFAPGGVATASFVGHAGAGGTSLVRLETMLTIDRPDRMASLRIGDTIARGGVGAVPVRFAGLQYGRNFDTQPGFITMPLPTLSGSAALPSTVDIYVNNALQGTKQVQPGPFQVAQIPVQAGGGNVRLVMHDVLGREIVSNQPYYAARNMLRRGLADFSYEVGFIRKGFGAASNAYGPLMGAVSERYGLTEALTIEGHVEATARVQQAGVGASLLAGRIGLFSGEASVSASRGRQGIALSGSLEHRAAAFSLGAHAQYASRAYSYIGASTALPRPRLSIETFFDLRLTDGASVGLNSVLRTRYDASKERVAGAYARLGIARLGTLQLYARYAQAERHTVVLGASFSLLLQKHRSATLSTESEEGRITTYASVQSNPPAGIGSGWHVEASAGRTNSVSGAYIVQTEASALTFQAAHAERQTGVRVSATGSVGFLDGRTFASRQLGNSFASVSVGAYPGVRVYADNQLVAKTDKSGRAIVPGLRAYETNEIRIEDADLPIEAQLAASDKVVRPFARSGVLLSFAPASTGGVVLWVRTEDGKPLPAGASVLFEGGDGSTVVAPGGMIYAPVSGPELRLKVHWDEATCLVTAVRPAAAGPQPILKGLVCRRPATFAQAR